MKQPTRRLSRNSFKDIVDEQVKNVHSHVQDTDV